MVRSAIPKWGLANVSGDLDTIFFITASTASAALKLHVVAVVIIAACAAFATAIGELRLDIKLNISSHACTASATELGPGVHVGVAVPAVPAASVLAAAACGTCRCCGSGFRLSLSVLSRIALFCSVHGKLTGGGWVHQLEN